MYHPPLLDHETAPLLTVHHKLLLALKLLTLATSSARSPLSGCERAHILPMTAMILDLQW